MIVTLTLIGFFLACVICFILGYRVGLWIGIATAIASLNKAPNEPISSQDVVNFMRMLK